VHSVQKTGSGRPVTCSWRRSLPAARTGGRCHRSRRLREALGFRDAATTAARPDL
jgi:hypothetical protein